MHRLEPLAAAVDRRAVREMSAMQQVQPHDGIAEGEQGLIDRVIGRSAGESLHIDEDLVGFVTVRCEGFRRAPASQRLDRVRVFHALVIARIAAAAIMSKSRRIIEDLLLAHPA